MSTVHSVNVHILGDYTCHIQTSSPYQALTFSSKF